MARHRPGSSISIEKDVSTDITICREEKVSLEETEDPKDEVMAGVAGPLIHNLAQKSSLTHRAPAGYALVHAMGLEQRLECLAGAEQSMRNRARQYGQTQGMEVPGFRPEDLLDSGALGSPNCEPSNLEKITQIHPLFRIENFNDCTEEMYKVMTPALQLASLFLTTPACLLFQSTILFGQGQSDAFLSFEKGGNCERIKEACQVTQERYKTIQQYYTELADHVQFQFSTTLQPQSWACTSKTPRTPEVTIVDHVIQLCEDHYTVLAKLSQTRYPDQAARLRFYFLLASHLCHELAHILAGCRRSTWFGLEPVLGTVHDNECGRQWEVLMFGGTFEPINNRADCAHGLAISNWPMTFTDRWDGLWHSIPHDYIQNLFSAQWWVRTVQRETDNDTGFLHIPRNGVQSAEVAVMETHLQTDEKTRVKEEELLTIGADRGVGMNASLGRMPVNIQPVSAFAASLRLASERERELEQLLKIQRKQRELGEKLQQAQEAIDQAYRVAAETVKRERAKDG
jgi:hypothetical protein